MPGRWRASSISCDGGAVLVTGAARMEDGTPAEKSRRYFNSIEILGRSGLLPEHYDKQHLVPFGEYMPFQSWLEQNRRHAVRSIPRRLRSWPRHEA